MNNKGSHRLRQPLILITIVVICVAPLLLARHFFYHAQSYRLQRHVQGQLVRPTAIAGVQFHDQSEKIVMAQFRGRWLMVYYSSHCCDDLCQQVTHKLSGIRTAITNAWQHTRVLVVTPNRCPLQTNRWGDSVVSLGYTAQQKKHWLAILPRAVKSHDGQVNTQVFLVDPRGFLMMRYEKKEPAFDVLKDLKHLLWVNRGNQV